MNTGLTPGAASGRKMTWSGNRVMSAKRRTLGCPNCCKGKKAATRSGLSTEWTSSDYQDRKACIRYPFRRPCSYLTTSQTFMGNFEQAELLTPREFGK